MSESQRLPVCGLCSDEATNQAAGCHTVHSCQPSSPGPRPSTGLDAWGSGGQHGGPRRCAYTVLTLDSRLLSLFLYVGPCSHFEQNVPSSLSFFSSTPLFFLGGSQKAEPNAGLQTISHLTTMPGPHYHCQSHYNSYNSKLCSVLYQNDFSQKCLPVVCTFLSLSPYSLCLSHIPPSVPSAIKVLKTTLSPPWFYRVVRLRPQFTENPAKCKQAQMHKLL